MAVMQIRVLRHQHFADDGTAHLGYIQFLLWYGADAWDWAWWI